MILTNFHQWVQKHQSFQTVVLGHLPAHMQNNTGRTLLCHLHSLRVDHRLKTAHNPLRPLKRKQRYKSVWSGFGNDFLRMTIKAEETKKNHQKSFYVREYN